MSGTNSLLRPLGNGLPLPGGNIPTPRGPRGAAQGAAPISLRGPTVPQMNRMVAQGPPPTAGGLQLPPQGGEPPVREAGGIGDLPDTFTDSRRTLMQQHDRNKAMYQETGESLKKLDVMRKGLEKLQDKQDLVTMEDIVHEAGKLVSHGIDPIALAGVIADAPQEGGGEALGGWVASHAQTAMQAEQQMLAAHNQARFQMGMSAVHLLMAQANEHHMTGTIPPIGEVKDSNDLTPSSADGGPDEHPGVHPGTAMQLGQRFMESK